MLAGMRILRFVAGAALLAGIAAAQNEAFDKALECGMAGLRGKDAAMAGSCLRDAASAAKEPAQKVRALALLAKADQLIPDFPAAEEHYRAAASVAETPGDRAATNALLAAFLAARERVDGLMTVLEKVDTPPERPPASAPMQAPPAIPVPKAPPVPTDKAGNGVSQPIPIYHPEPEYSELARLTGLTGSVLVYIEVDVNGAVVNPKLLKPLGFGLDENAIAAVLLWKFKPGMLNGNPVRVIAQVEVNFRLF